MYISYTCNGGFIWSRHTGHSSMACISFFGMVSSTGCGWASISCIFNISIFSLRSSPKDVYQLQPTTLQINGVLQKTSMATWYVLTIPTSEKHKYTWFFECLFRTFCNRLTVTIIHTRRLSSHVSAHGCRVGPSNWRKEHICNHDISVGDKPTEQYKARKYSDFWPK